MVQLLQRIVTPVVEPLSTTAIVFIVSIFILLQREDLRDRMIRLFGSSDLHRTTIAMNDAARRLSRYLLTQLVVNSAFGAIIATGLAFIGIPSPVIWGVLGALLRFVPYIGAPLSAVMPLALAAAVDPGWSRLLWTAALYLVVEPVMAQVVEPLLYGHSTGLSPFAVVLAATFWTWLWGPIGLILSTPLTLCLVVLGRHVARLEFLDVLLGDRPALTPVESFYQRILAGDPDEAHDQAEVLLKQRSLSSYYDDVALPGLRLAVIDAERGVLTLAHLERIKLSIQSLIEDLDDHEDRQPPPARPRRPSPRRPRNRPMRNRMFRAPLPTVRRRAGSSLRRHGAARRRCCALPAAGCWTRRFPQCSRNCWTSKGWRRGLCRTRQPHGPRSAHWTWAAWRWCAFPTWSCPAVRRICATCCAGCAGACRRTCRCWSGYGRPGKRFCKMNGCVRRWARMTTRARCMRPWRRAWTSHTRRPSANHHR